MAYIGNKPTNVPLSSADLPDNIVTSAKIADDAVDSDQLASGAVDDAHLATGITSSKLSGALPALDASSLTSIPAGNLTGTVADARISALTASKLSGALPAISGASLTNLDARDLENALPAISGASLTGLPAQAEADYFSFDMSSATGTTVHTISGSFTPTVAWMVYDPNGTQGSLVIAWLCIPSPYAHGAQTTSSTNTVNRFYHGGTYMQCQAGAGRQDIKMSASASGQYTIHNTLHSASGTGHFSLILFGN